MVNRPTDRKASALLIPPVVNRMANRDAFAPKLSPEADWVTYTPVLAPPSGFKDDFISPILTLGRMGSSLCLLTLGRTSLCFPTLGMMLLLQLLALRMMSICFLIMWKKSLCLEALMMTSPHLLTAESSLLHIQVRRIMSFCQQNHVGATYPSLSPCPNP